MAGGDHAPATLRRYGEAQSAARARGGYGWRDHAIAVLRGLGFADADLDRGLETFSGGELTRASLARALAGGPDLLLLDEPTNHLDMESIEWLEQELSTIDAAVILVAHDRWFLESVATAVLELEGGRSTFFPGKWHVWRQEKAARLAEPGEVGRAAGGGHRAARALRRALPLRDEVAAGAGEAEADRADRGGAGRGAARRPAHARLRVPEAGAERPDGASRRRASTSPPARSRCSRTPSSCSSAASTSR